jgi:hypothetical protein
MTHSPDTHDVLRHSGGRGERQEYKGVRHPHADEGEKNMGSGKKRRKSEKLFFLKKDFQADF